MYVSRNPGPVAMYDSVGHGVQVIYCGTDYLNVLVIYTLYDDIANIMVTIGLHFTTNVC